MGEINISYAVDAGNTRLKIGEFQNDELKKVSAFSWSDDNWKSQLALIDGSKAILSTVLSDQKNKLLKKYFKPKLVFNHQTTLPISIEKYETPKTLGLDRIANAVAVAHLKTTKNALSIDVGTCIKYDLILGRDYLGGAISPGIEMRFKAMHEFTGNLPLLISENLNSFPLVGNSTKKAMISGVKNGVLIEINGKIKRYQESFDDLTIFLTGGDANRFDLENKKCIFVELNLTLIGLFLILKHNDS